MITPIQPIEYNTVKSQNPRSQNGSGAPVKKETELKFSIEWHCERCDRNFLAPKAIKGKDGKKITKLNCPYCGGNSITNNYQTGGYEWEV